MSETKLFQSRARALGISPRKLATQTRRTLKAARASLEKMALPYADIDYSVDYALLDLLSAFDEFEEQIGETVKWLEEPIGS